MVKKSVLVLGLLVTYFGIIFTAGEYAQFVHPTTASLTVNGTPQKYGTELFIAIALLITFLGLFICYIGIYNPPWVKDKLSKLAYQPYNGSNRFNQQSQSLKRFENQHHLPNYSDVNVNNRPHTLQTVDEGSTPYSTDTAESFDSSPEPELEFQKKIEIHSDSQNRQDQSVDSLLDSLEPVDENSSTYSNDYLESSESSAEPFDDYSESFDSTYDSSKDYSESFDSSPQASDKACPFCGGILTNPADPFCNNCGKRLN